MGVFVKQNGLLWKTDKSEYNYLWKNIKTRVVINFKFFKLVEVSSTNQPSVRFLVSWLMDNKGFEKITEYCPKDHELYKLVEEYKKN